jgi:hypothetical protein
MMNAKYLPEGVGMYGEINAIYKGSKWRNACPTTTKEGAGRNACLTVTKEAAVSVGVMEGEPDRD